MKNDSIMTNKYITLAPDMDCITVPTNANYQKLIGKLVKLPDEGVGRISAICLSGFSSESIEWQVVYWYNGCKTVVWVDPCEAELLNDGN